MLKAPIKTPETTIYTPDDILAGIFPDPSIMAEYELEGLPSERIDSSSPLLGFEAYLHEPDADSRTLNGVFCVGERVCGIVKIVGDSYIEEVQVVDLSKHSDEEMYGEGYREAEVIGRISLDDKEGHLERGWSRFTRGSLTITDEHSQKESLDEATITIGTGGEAWLTAQKGKVVVLSNWDIMEAQNASLKKNGEGESSRISAIHGIVEAAKPLVNHTVAR